MRSIIIKTTHTVLLSPECPTTCAKKGCNLPITFTDAGWIDDSAHGPAMEPEALHSCVLHQKECHESLMHDLLAVMIAMYNVENDIPPTD